VGVGTITGGTCGPTGPTGQDGKCTVIVSSKDAGQSTVNALGTVSVGSANIAVATNGYGAHDISNVKTWVDAYITVGPPEADNPVGTNHVYTARVFVNAGTGAGYVAAPDGTAVTFTLLTGSVGSFKAGKSCVTSGGTCTITTTSAKAGNDTMQASTTVTVGGVALTRTTGQAAPAHANGGNAIKHWIPPFTPPTIVERPAISITKNPKLQTIAQGATATFSITVTNTGKETLKNVTVTDRLSPRCNRKLGTMAPGASRTYTCTRAKVKKGYLNVAVVVGTSPKGKKVTDRDSALVRVLPPKPKPKPEPKPVEKPKVVSNKKPKATG
jgi:uncharacterized repeat protein (TIGR01451 family)